MGHMKEFVLTAESLCSTIDRAIENNDRAMFDLSLMIEQMTWEAYRSANELRQYNESLGE